MHAEVGRRDRSDALSDAMEQGVEIGADGASRAGANDQIAPGWQAGGEPGDEVIDRIEPWVRDPRRAAREKRCDGLSAFEADDAKRETTSVRGILDGSEGRRAGRVREQGKLVEPNRGRNHRFRALDAGVCLAGQEVPRVQDPRGIEGAAQRMDHVDPEAELGAEHGCLAPTDAMVMRERSTRFDGGGERALVAKPPGVPRLVAGYIWDNRARVTALPASPPRNIFIIMLCSKIIIPVFLVLMVSPISTLQVMQEWLLQVQGMYSQV